MRPLQVAPLASSDLSRAALLLRRFNDQDLTLVDALGLYVMVERRITTCWSTDFHLGLTGARLAIYEG